MPDLLIPYKETACRCLYDQEDHDLVSQYAWHINEKGYAVAWDRERKRNILMHRAVLGVIDNPSVEVDHRLHNRLDNRKSQLRICNHSQNKQNSLKVAPGTSAFKGVYYETERGRFHSQIGLGERRVKNLGRYSCEKLAAKVYDRKALELFREFACLNFNSSREAEQLMFPWYEA